MEHARHHYERFIHLRDFKIIWQHIKFNEADSLVALFRQNHYLYRVAHKSSAIFAMHSCSVPLIIIVIIVRQLFRSLLHPRNGTLEPKKKREEKRRDENKKERKTEMTEKGTF